MLRTNTLIALGASLIGGAIAVYLAQVWVQDALRSELAASQSSSQIEQSQSVSVPVIVANVPLEFGTEIQSEHLRIAMYPQEAAPEGAYQSLKDVFDDQMQTRRVLSYMDVNEPLMRHRVSGPDARGSLSLKIPVGKRAVSVRVDDVTGVSGFILPGDHVDVLFTRDQSTRRNGNNLISDVLLQNVRVLGIDQNNDERSSTPDIAKTVTLEVTNAQAQTLSIAMDAGRLNLTLRSMGDATFDNSKTIHQKQLLNADSRKTKRPARKSRRVAKKPASDRQTQVTVIRGEDRDDVSVSVDTETATPAMTLAKR